MFDIRNIQENEFDKCKKFLKSVPTIKEIENDILKDATLVFDQEEIIGCVSYETYSNIGLIRYFVFKKVLNDSLIKTMFENLEKRAYEKGINKLYCLVNNEIIKSLFSSLSFNQTDTQYLYIDEQHFANLDYKDSEVMVKELVIDEKAIM